MSKQMKPAAQHTSRQVVPEATSALLSEFVAHLRQNRTQLREEWIRRITEAQLLTAMTKEEIFAEATSVFDNYVEVLETGSIEALQAYARSLSERIIPRGVETQEVVGIVLLLRDVLARSLFKKYQTNFDLLNRVLDAYEPAANRIANTVAVGFVQERERIIRHSKKLSESSLRRCCRFENDCLFFLSLASLTRNERDRLRNNCCEAFAPTVQRSSLLILQAYPPLTRTWQTTWCKP